MNNFQQYIQLALAIAQAVLAVLGGLYVIASMLGAFFPNTAFGIICRKIAGDIQQVIADIKQVAPATSKLGALGDVPDSTKQPDAPAAVIAPKKPE